MSIGLVVLTLAICHQSAANTLIGGLVTWRPKADASDMVLVQQWNSFDDRSCLLAPAANTWYVCSVCPYTLDSPGDSLSVQECVLYPDVTWSVAWIQQEYEMDDRRGTVTLRYWLIVPTKYKYFQTTIDTRLRSDTGLVNSPPVTSYIPIIKVNAGCSRDITIPISDIDNDRVSCRFVLSSDPTVSADGGGGCGSYCTPLPNSYVTLNESTCTLSYSGFGTAGDDVIINVIIMDYPNTNITVGGDSFTTEDYLSETSLQFLVQVGAGLTNCTEVPQISSLGPNINLLVGEFYNYTVVATATPGYNVTAIRLYGLHGFVVTEVVAAGNGTFVSSVSWQATSSFVGNNVACFVAEQDSGLESEPKCITITVGNTSLSTTTTIPNPCLSGNGGCSDACDWSGSAATCSCNNSCWHLAADAKTCIPKVEFLCESDGVEITVAKCASSDPMAVNSFDPLNSASIPAECAPSVNSTHTSFKFAHGQCSSIATESDTTIQYENWLRVWIANDTSTITRSPGYAMAVVCAFPKHTNLTSAFDPLDQYVNFLAVPGLGYFTFTLKLYVDQTFDTAHIDEPVVYPLNSDIYFAVRATGGSGLTLFTENCYAYPDVTGAEELATAKHNLINDGCMEDYTMKTYTATDPLENRFSVKAFRFLDVMAGISNETNVIIKCSVVICVDDVTSTRCATGCVTSPTRRRRQAGIPQQSLNGTTYNLSTVIETSAHVVTSIKLHVEPEESKGGIPLNDLVLGLSILVALLFLICSCGCCAFLLLGARRRKKRKDEKEPHTNGAFDFMTTE